MFRLKGVGTGVINRPDMILSQCLQLPTYTNGETFSVKTPVK